MRERIVPRHQRNLGQVETLAQQVDADQHVVLTLPQLREQFDAAQGVRIRTRLRRDNDGIDDVTLVP